MDFAKDFIAGIIAGGIAKTIGAPIDRFDFKKEHHELKIGFIL